MKKDGMMPHFSPGSGVEIYPTVKEQVVGLLKSGFFDGLTACVIAGSEERGFDIRLQGSAWECSALIVQAGFQNQKRYG